MNTFIYSLLQLLTIPIVPLLLGYEPRTLSATHFDQQQLETSRHPSTLPKAWSVALRYPRILGIPLGHPLLQQTLALIYYRR